MPTTAQITAESATLSTIVRGQLLAVIRDAARYKRQPDSFANLADVIAAADGNVKAQQLNAALKLIEAIGDGTIEISGAADGLEYSQTRDREQLLDYMIAVLYEQPPRTLIGSASVPTEFQF